MLNKFTTGWLPVNVWASCSSASELELNISEGNMNVARDVDEILDNNLLPAAEQRIPDVNWWLLQLIFNFLYCFF